MAERIEDFGNKIGGAKKDLAAKNKTNLEIADVEKWTSLERKEYITKKNVWVQPDYRKLVDEDGVSVVCAYFIKKVRDSLPAKPKYPRSVTAETSQEQYIQYISEIRDKVMTLKNESEIRDFFRWICDEYTRGRYVNEKSHGYLDNKLYKLAQSSADSLKRKLKKDHFLFSDDEIKLSNYNIIKADSIMNTAYDTRSCLVVKSGGSTYYYWNWKNDDNSLYKDINWKPDTYYVADKDNNIIANNFKSKEAAEKFVVENSELNIEKRKTNRRKLFVPPLLKVIQRIGMNYREEEHADGQKMLDTFGFYGGEFGNWERQTERQMNLDYSYDAFMDLAYALDIDEKDISLGGKLSLAYGARGHGNALAHYEAFANVINLTRMKGAGSLAHEYGHAIDSFLAQQYDTGKAFITDTYIPIISNLMNTIKYTEVKGIKTDFFSEAQGMDKDYTGYWGSNRELFARAFACYLKDKLAEKGIRNDYLCGHCESAGTKGEERIRINAAFDAMFAELKEQGIFHSVNHDKVTEVVVREDIIVENNAESEKEAEEEIPITQADIDILRTLTPRKSVLNFTDEERALTANWAKRFENDIGEKSPYFRGEKGDWRENEDTKVPVINIVSTKKDFKNVRNDIKERIITRGEIINTDTNWNIQISRNGLEDTVKYGFKHKNPNVYDMLYSISDIVQNGIYLDSTLSENNNSTKANNTAFMHKLYGICKLDEEFCISKITVEEFKSGNQTTLKRLYNLQDIKIEPLRHIEFINDRLARSVLNGSEISISDLFAIVKSCDKDFYLNKRENPEINVTDIKKEPLRHVSFTAEQPHLKVLNGSEISISDSAENVNNESEQSNNSPVGNKQGKTMSKSQIGGKNNMSFRIIGDADYRNMQDKKYINGSADEIGMLAEALLAQGISFSGNITNTRGTITVSGTEMYRKACDMLKAFQQSAPESEKKNVIETKPYKYIADKKYVNGDEESIRKVIDILIKKKMEFSSNIRSKDRAAITVSGEENRKLVQSYLDYVRNEKAILAVKEYGFVITDTVNLTVKSPVGGTMSFDDYEQLNSAFEDIDNEFFHPTAYQVLETSDAFDEFYALYRIDTITGEEKGIVYNSDGEYVGFANVDEIMEYVGKEGIEIINSKEQLDSWAENDRNRLIERNHSVYVQMFEGDNHIELLPDNKVVWTYYNEDGKEGIGQLIEMTIREDVITEAWERWASVFGETETAMEVKPTGDGQYQNKTRFAHFINLPELQTVFRDVADVKLVSGLNIERPDAKIHNVNVPASRYQRRYVKKLGKRSEACRAGLVDKHIDNMLKITTDGRKVGLDARCIDPNIPDDPASKVNVCINNVFDIWKKTEEKRSTQLIFCDLATPQKPKNEDRYFVFRKQEDGTYAKIYSGGIRTKDKSPERILESLKKKLPKDFVEDEMCGVLAEGDIIVSKTVDIKGGMIEHSGIEIGKGGIGKPVTGVVLNDIGTPPQEVYEHEKSFCVYDDIKDKLVKMGVPAEEIAFIHDCKNNEEKQKLFDKMNKGEVRIMIGSTQKCGAGMNAQAKMIALHDLDAPYRPSDVEHLKRNTEKRIEQAVIY